MQSVPYRMKTLSAKFPWRASLFLKTGSFTDTLCAFDAGATATKNVFRSVISPTISGMDNLGNGTKSIGQKRNAVRGNLPGYTIEPGAVFFVV